MSPSEIVSPVYPYQHESRDMRAMRARKTRCGTILALSLDVPFRIKSPQLYRLSYRPVCSYSFRKTACHDRPVSGCVSPVCPLPIAERSYHGFCAVSS